MTKNNVIQFPDRKKLIENIENIDDDDIHKDSLVFAYEVIDTLHDMLHEQTGDCIFTDEEYMSLTICATEVISSIYMMSQGRDHPFQEIAADLFDDVEIDGKESVDILDNLVYDNTNEELDEE